MIDLHCHLLPQIDDGSRSLAESLQMARIAVSEGITVSACTPHILPGVYDNTGPAIVAAIDRLQAELLDADIPLQLVGGADVHVAPDLLDGLRNGRVLPLAQSRYFLLEPPQAVLPPRFEGYLFSLVSAGYVPIITHPERLSWVESHYGVFARLVRMGVWTQLTAGSLTGGFGKRARYWSEKMLEDGLVHIIASDAHDSERRPPHLTGAYDAAFQFLGHEEALHLVVTRPVGILRNANPADLPSPRHSETSGNWAEGLWKRASRRVGM